MSYQTREFTKIVQVSLNQLLDMQYAQLQTKKRFLNQLNDNQFSSALSTVTSILSIVFASSTATSVATSIGSLFTSMAPSERDIASDSADFGYIGLGEPIQVMRNPNYNILEIELPYLEYSEWQTGEKTQFITAAGLPLRVQTNSGWIVL